MPTTINPSGQTITQYNIQTGGASNLLNNVAPSATSGVPIISQGASSQPVFGTAVVAGGGTGNSTQPAYSLVCGGTTTTSSFQAVSDVATGQVLVSGGVSALPAFSATPTVTSITLGTGTALSVNVDNTSFTPTLTFGGGSTGLTYSIQQGYYSRIGNVVHVHIAINVLAVGSSTGAAVVGGLPYTIKNQSNYYPTFACEAGTFTGLAGATPVLSYNYVIGRGQANNTTIAIFACGPSTSATQMGNTNFEAGSQLLMSGFYFT